MSFTIYELILVVGVFQGSLTASLLWNNKVNTVGNRCLALALLSFSLICFKTVLISSGLTKTQWFAYPPIAIELAAGPLFFLYMRSMISPNFAIKPSDYLHFLPFFFFQGFVLIVYFSVVFESDFMAKKEIAESLYYWKIKDIEDYLIVASILGYVIRAYLELKQYRRKVADNISDNTVTMLGWMYRLVQLSAVLGVVNLTNQLLDIFFNLEYTTIVHWQFFLVLIACFVYYFGFVGYSHRDLDPIDFDINESPTIDRDKLASEEIKNIAKKLKSVLNTEKVYLNPKLNAQQLAKTLGISQTNLSFVINNHFDQSFRDLINQYRVEEVKRKLLDKTHENHSILSIALDSGFNSEASFYRVFKNVTGMSPTAYVESKQHASQN